MEMADEEVHMKDAVSWLSEEESEMDSDCKFAAAGSLGARGLRGLGNEKGQRPPLQPSTCSGRLRRRGCTMAAQRFQGSRRVAAAGGGGGCGGTAVATSGGGCPVGG